MRRFPQGPRCWIAGQRVHHGSAGIVLVVAGMKLKMRPLVVLGAALAAHDRADWRVWFAREGIPTL